MFPKKRGYVRSATRNDPPESSRDSRQSKQSTVETGDSRDSRQSRQRSMASPFELKNKKKKRVWMYASMCTRTHARTHAHTRTRVRAHARTQADTHACLWKIGCLSLLVSSEIIQP